MRIRLGRQARRDLAGISRYTLEQFGPAQEELYLAGLWQHFEALAQFPGIGREVDPVRHRRVSTYQKHLVLYAIEPNAISISRVLHSAQQAEYEKAIQARADL